MEKGRTIPLTAEATSSIGPGLSARLFYLQPYQPFYRSQPYLLSSHAKIDRQAAPVWHFMPCSRALLGAGLPLQGSKKIFRRRPAKTPLPLISDCPGGVVPPLPRQHSALLLFLMPGIAQTRLMCLAALAFQCRVVNVVFHLARTADKTTVFLAEPQRQGRKPHTITL